MIDVFEAVTLVGTVGVDALEAIDGRFSTGGVSMRSSSGTINNRSFVLGLTLIGDISRYPTSIVPFCGVGKAVRSLWESFLGGSGGLPEGG